MYPDDSVAFSHIAELQDYYDGNLSDAQYGARSIDHTIWALEALANYNHCDPDVEFHSVTHDTMEVEIGLNDKEEAIPGEIWDAYDEIEGELSNGLSSDEHYIATDVSYKNILPGNTLVLYIDILVGEGLLTPSPCMSDTQTYLFWGYSPYTGTGGFGTPCQGLSYNFTMTHLIEQRINNGRCTPREICSDDALNLVITDIQSTESDFPYDNQSAYRNPNDLTPGDNVQEFYAFTNTNLDTANYLNYVCTDNFDHSFYTGGAREIVDIIRPGNKLRLAHNVMALGELHIHSGQTSHSTVMWHKHWATYGHCREDKTGILVP